jgi:YesN/AraC family two-component response regulator
MDDYLSKPIAADNLRDTLIRFIGTDPSRAVEEASAE